MGGQIIAKVTRSYFWTWPTKKARGVYNDEKILEKFSITKYEV